MQLKIVVPTFALVSVLTYHSFLILIYILKREVYPNITYPIQIKFYTFANSEMALGTHS